MQTLSCFVARRSMAVAMIFIAITPASAAPMPRPKPVIVYQRVETVPPAVPAIIAPSKPDPSSDAGAAGVAAPMLWEIYRLLWLLAALVLGVVALGIWQAFAARDTARRRLRAYVSVWPGIAPHLDSDWTDATVVVKNQGVTPAFALDHAVTLMMIDYPELPLADVMGAADKMFGKKSIMLAPGMEITLPLRTVLSEDEKHETEDGTHKRLCAIGEIRYADAFGKKHFTRFCFAYGGAAIISSGQMQIAEKGNEGT